MTETDEQPSKASPATGRVEQSEREIEYTTAFKRDFKRDKKGRYRSTIEAELAVAFRFLTTDVPLPARYADHGLTGNWKGHRDCHVRPDLVLIYSKPEEPPLRLRLVRLGSHSELGI